MPGRLVGSVLVVLIALTPAAIAQPLKPAKVKGVAFSRNGALGTFKADVDIAGFTAGYHRLVALPAQDAAFQVYPRFSDGSDGESERQQLSYFESTAASQRKQAAALPKALAKEPAAYAEAKRKKERSYAVTSDGQRLFFDVEHREQNLKDYRKQIKDLEEGAKASAAQAAELKAAVEARNMQSVVGHFRDGATARIDLFVAPANGDGPLQHVGAIDLKFPKTAARSEAVESAWTQARSAHLVGPSEFNDPRGGRMPGAISAMSGYAAAEEAFQVEDMRRGAAVAEQAETIPVASLEGPKIASHPYDKMRGGAKVRPLPVADAIPSTNWVLAVSSSKAALTLIDLLDSWGTDAAHALERTAQDRGTKERLFAQLGLSREVFAGWDQGALTDTIALTGHDPFIREGTDVTLLLRGKDAAALRSSIDGAWTAARTAQKAAVRDARTIGGVTVERLSSPDRRLSAHLLETGGYVVLGNSEAGVRAVIDTLAKKAPNLSSQPDFKYVRSRPLEGTEDAFLYLSDAFVRNVVSASWKVADLRRSGCANHLRELSHQHLNARAARSGATTVEALVQDGLLAQAPRCAAGGKYALDGDHPRCSVHGTLEFLTPLVELPVQAISAAEAERYKAFLTGYSAYWTTFIDPIVVQAQLGPPIVIRTTILPLVENSVYSQYRDLLGDAPVRLVRAGESDRSIVSVNFAWTRSKAIQEMVREWVRDFSLEGRDPWEWLGEEVSLVIYDGDPLLTAQAELIPIFAGGGGSGDALATPIGTMIAAGISLPTSLVFQVKNPDRAREAMERLGTSMQRRFTDGRGMSRWLGQTGFASYKLDEGNGQARIGVLSATVFGTTLRVYWTLVGNELYIATRQWLAEDFLKRGAPTPAALDPVDGHVRLRLQYSQLRQAASAVQAGWGESMRQVCFSNLMPLQIVSEAHPAGGDLATSAKAAYGTTLYCPAGGRYALNAERRPACSVHGTSVAPRMPAHLSQSADTVKWLNRFRELDMTLTFTKEGLESRMVLTPK